jgi:hypothetical protein
MFCFLYDHVVLSRLQVKNRIEGELARQVKSLFFAKAKAGVNFQDIIMNSLPNQ